MSANWIGGCVTLLAVALLVMRIAWPELKIDSVTIGLGLVALFPWLGKIVKSAKLPGGWEVVYQDLAKAGAALAEEASKAPQAGNVRAPDRASQDWFAQIAATDPSLALVSLRIEIEKRMRRLATKHDISERLPLHQLQRELQSREVLNSNIIGALRELIAAGNSAAHGAEVDSRAVAWALNSGPSVLASLDAIMGAE